MGLQEKTLIVEDDESLRLLYSTELSNEGYECLLVGNRDLTELKATIKGLLDKKRKAEESGFPQRR